MRYMAIPTPMSKVIPVNLDFKNSSISNWKPFNTGMGFWTNDIGTAFLEFSTELDLTGTVASIVLENQYDKSLVQKTITEITSSPFYYQLGDEIQHEGRWFVQISVKKGEETIVSNSFAFMVNASIGHGKVARLVSIETFETLATQLTALQTDISNYLETAETNEAIRVSTYDEIVLAEETRKEAEDIREANDISRGATATADNTRANTDHSTAVLDHSTALTDHSTSTTDHTTALADHSIASSDHSTAVTDHTRANTDHITALADHTSYEGLLTDGVLATNIENKLLYLETTYAPELNSVKQQLAEAVTKSELSAIATPLVATLVSQMTNVARIYVYKGVEVGYTDGNWYYHNGTEWVSGGVYQSTGINKTLVTMSKNIFDKTKIITRKEVYSNGTFSVQADSAISGYIDIPVGSGVDLYISGLTPYATGMDRYIWFYTDAKATIGTLQNIDNLIGEKYFTIPENARYVAFSIYQRKTSAETINLDTIQVEFGAVKTDYVPFKQGISRIDALPIAADFGDIVITPKTSGKKLLIFGDSISETASISEDGLTYTEGNRSNWPAFAKAPLAITYKNYARSGARYKDQAIVGDVRKSLSAQINMALANGETADIVVVSAGANDGSASLGNYDTAMAKTTLVSLDRSLLYEAIRWTMWKIRTNYPNAVCFAATPIHRASAEPISDLNTAIIKMANRYNFIVIDATNKSGIVRDFEIAGAQGRYLYDGLHPGTSGQQLMADLYASEIAHYYNH